MTHHIAIASATQAGLGILFVSAAFFIFALVGWGIVKLARDHASIHPAVLGMPFGLALGLAALGAYLIGVAYSHGPMSYALAGTLFVAAPVLVVAVIIRVLRLRRRPPTKPTS